MSNPNSDKESDEIDLLSPNFNPLKALYSSRVQLPLPTATIFNNLREYEWITATGIRSDSCRGAAGSSDGSASGRGRHGRGNEAGSGGKSSSSRGKKEQVPFGRGFRATNEMLIDTNKKKQRTYRNVLTRMSECTSGPLFVLYRCMNERCKVRVCTRSFKGLRGICTGYLVTFDKFFNMALVDVDEVWRRPSTGQRFYHEEKMTFSKIMECSRPQVSEDSKQWVEPRTEQTKEGGQLRKEGNTSEKDCRKGVTKDSLLNPKLKDEKHLGQKSVATFRGGDGQRSVKQDPRGHRHGHRDEEERSKSRKGEKPSWGDLVAPKKRETKKSPESQHHSAGEGDEEIKDLQQRLATLRKELTSLSVDEREKSPKVTRRGHQRSPDATTEDGGVTDFRLTQLYKDLNTSSGEEQESVEVEDVDGISTKSRDSHFRDGERVVLSTASLYHQGSTVLLEGSTEARVQESGQGTKGDTKQKGVGHQKDHVTREIAEQSSRQVAQTESKCSTDASIKRGRFKIKVEDFQRRHVNQLFIRGDNVVLVSVDSILLPK